MQLRIFHATCLVRACLPAMNTSRTHDTSLLAQFHFVVGITKCAPCNRPRPRPVRRFDVILRCGQGLNERRRARGTFVRVHARDDPRATDVAHCGAEEERG